MSVEVGLLVGILAFVAYLGIHAWWWHVRVTQVQRRHGHGALFGSRVVYDDEDEEALPGAERRHGHDDGTPNPRRTT